MGAGIKALLALSATLVAALVLVSRAPYQSPSDKDIGKVQSPRPGDITKERAMQAAQDRFRDLGFQAQGELNAKLIYDTFLRRVWELQWHRHFVTIDASTAGIVDYRNSHRVWEQVRGLRRGMTNTIRTEDQARERLQAIANVFGLPQGAYLAELRMFNEGDPRYTDANPAGRIDGAFSIRVNGYAFHKHCRPHLGLSIDPTDGALLRISNEWRKNVVSSTARLSREEAVAAARGLFAALIQRAPTLHGVARSVTPANATLEYVTAKGARLDNGRVVSAPVSQTYPLQARLAWVVRFGREEIWIDAATGDQISALILR